MKTQTRDKIDDRLESLGDASKSVFHLARKILANFRGIARTMVEKKPNRNSTEWRVFKLTKGIPFFED